MFSLTRGDIAVGFVLFTFRSCVATIEEYTPLFMAQLGYSTLYIGIVPLFGFVTQLIGIPLAGYLSDIRVRKVMLLLCIVISIPTILLFLVPNAPDAPCELLPQRNSSFGNNTTKPAAIANLLDKNSDTGFTFFLIIFFLRGIYELFKKLSVSLITVATMTNIKDDKAKLGYYGCWGELGAGISLFVVGVLAGHIFHSVCGEKVPSYYVAFLYAAAVQCLAPLALPWMKYEYLEKRVVNNAEVKSILYNPHYILILFICAHAGLCSAFQLRWEFWYMEQLGGSPFVMAVGGLLRRPIVAVWFVLSPAVIGKLGELNVIAISLFIFAASFAALAFAENAWLVIVYDNFQAASFVLTYTSFVIHFSKAGSKASSAFFQAVSLMVHGTGKEIGTLIMGFLFDKIGTKLTLCFCSIVTMIWLAVFTTYILTAKDLDGYMQVPTEEDENDDDKD